MSKNLFFCFVLTLLLCVSVFSQFEVRLSPVSNLTYQLDCASNQPMGCSYQNITALWKKEFLGTSEDKMMLKEWARLRSDHTKWLTYGQGDGESEIWTFNKIRIAGLQSDSVDDYLRRLDMITAPSERTKFEKVIRHFYPRFKKHWDSNVNSKALKYQKEMQELLNSEKISNQIRSFVNFYSPSLSPGYDTSFNLFYSPDLVQEGTSGEQIENYSLVEFKLDENPKRRVDVVVHELCHFYFNNIAKSKMAALEKSFFELNEPLAMPTYYLMDETIATAFGNGMILRSVATKESFEKVLSIERSFYNDIYIDGTAKATLPFLDKILARKGSIHEPGFAREYYREAKKAFDGKKLTPSVFLVSMLLIVDGELKELTLRKVGRALGGRSVSGNRGSWDEKELQPAIKNTKRQNSLLIMKAENLDGAVKKGVLSKSDVSLIRKAAKTKNVVFFNKQRGNYINNYYVVVKNSDAVYPALEKLAKMEQFIGIK